jgi:hypothetical protein
MSNEFWSFDTLWKVLGSGAAALLAREVFTYLLGRKKIVHSAEMEKTRAERDAERERAEADRQAKREDYVGTLQEWRNYAKDRDRRIKQLEEKGARHEEELHETRAEVHSLTYQNLLLQTRLNLYERALVAAKIPIPNFDVEPPSEIERVAVVARESLGHE